MGLTIPAHHKRGPQPQVRVPKKTPPGNRRASVGTSDRCHKAARAEDCAEELLLYEAVSMKIEVLLPQVVHGNNPSINLIIEILTKDVPALPGPTIYIVWHSKLGVFMHKLSKLPNAV